MRIESVNRLLKCHRSWQELIKGTGVVFDSAADCDLYDLHVAAGAGWLPISSARVMAGAWVENKTISPSLSLNYGAPCRTQVVSPRTS